MKRPYVTITEDGRGYYLVLLRWNSQLNKYEPTESSRTSFTLREYAVTAGRAWAAEANADFKG